MATKRHKKPLNVRSINLVFVLFCDFLWQCPHFRFKRLWKSEGHPPNDVKLRSVDPAYALHGYGEPQEEKREHRDCHSPA